MNPVTHHQPITLWPVDHWQDAHFGSIVYSASDPDTMRLILPRPDGRATATFSFLRDGMLDTLERVAGMVVLPLVVDGRLRDFYAGAGQLEDFLAHVDTLAFAAEVERVDVDALAAWLVTA